MQQVVEGDAEVGDLAGAAVFLCCAESDYVTGATWYADGGILL